MILFAPCKINIGLDVVAKRNDGYHDLESVMVPVEGLCDIVEVVKSPQQGVIFSNSGMAMDCTDQDNLCVKAYELLYKRYGVGGAKIHLHKIIPFGAGLGGGSSDAAYTLKGLNDIFELELDTSTLETLAGELGSDVPFFIRNIAQLATGRGEILSPIGLDFCGHYLLIIKPPICISTAQAYGCITPYRPSLPLCERINTPIGEWRKTICNSFENTIFELYPLLKQAKEQLYSMGAVYGSMSGSGAALYGIFDTLPSHYDWPKGYFVHGEYIVNKNL